MPNSAPDFDSTELELNALLSHPSTTDHPNLELLQAAGHGILPSHIDQRIQRHLQVCQLCSMLLTDLATLPEPSLTSIEQTRLEAKLPTHAPGTLVMPAPAGLRSRPLPIFAAAAAALVLAALTTFVLHHQPTTDQAATPAPILQPQPAPVEIAQLESPLKPLAPPTDAALTTRGTSTGPTVDELLPAFTAYNRHDYALAAKRFTPLAARYPSSENVYLYLGISQLFLNDNQAAYATLTPAGAPRSDAGRWYAAIAAQRIHAPETKGLLQPLCNDPKSKYSADSCAILKTLP